MYSYAGQSATATKVTQLPGRPKVVNPSGRRTQARQRQQRDGQHARRATRSQGRDNRGDSRRRPRHQRDQPGHHGTTDPLSELWFLLTGQTALPTNLGTLVNGYSPFAGLFYNTEGLPYFSIGMGNNFVQIAKSVGAIRWRGSGRGQGRCPAWVGWAACSAAVPPRRTRWRRWAVRPRWVASCRCRWPGRSARPQCRPPRGRPSRSAASAPPRKPRGDPATCSAACRWPVTGRRGHGVAGPKYGFRPTVMARPPFAG